MNRRTLHLTPEERTQLEACRDTDRRPYLREQAAALLKIASGQSPHRVARHGLLKPRDPDTVYAWLNHFEKHRLPRTYPKRKVRRDFSP